MNISTSLEGDNGFVFIHAAVSYSLLVLALILNVLVFVLVKLSKRITDFRNVFYTYCVANVIFAAVFSIALMQWIFLPGMVVYFPTGPFAHNLTITPIIFKLQTVIYIYVMCLVSSTFVYRYLIVVRDYINTKIGERFALDFRQIYMFIVEIRTFQLDLWHVFRLVHTVIQLNIMNMIMIWTGVRIYQTIQRSVGSQQSKIMERNAFRLLLSQAINPIFLLHFPTIINFIQAEVMVLPDVINQVTCVMMSLFTVTNPLLNIIFTKDLTNSLKPDGRKESIRKKSSVFVSQSTF